MPLTATHIEGLERTRQMFLDFVADWQRLEGIMVTDKSKAECYGKAYAYQQAAQALEPHITALKAVL